MLVYWSAYLAKSSKCVDVSFHASLPLMDIYHILLMDKLLKESSTFAGSQAHVFNHHVHLQVFKKVVPHWHRIWPKINPWG